MPLESFTKVGVALLNVILARVAYTAMVPVCTRETDRIRSELIESGSALLSLPFPLQEVPFDHAGASRT